MKYLSLLFIIFFFSCSDIKQTKTENPNTIQTKPTLGVTKTSLLDSIQSITRVNVIKSFQIKDLQTDSFDNMVHVDKNLYDLLYPDQEHYAKNTFYIFSHIPRNNKGYSFIIYQRNYEGEDYRVDHMDLINLNAKGDYLYSVRLTTNDSAVFIYEVSSELDDDILKVHEESSYTEEENVDTLHIIDYTFKLFGAGLGLDTVNVERRFELIGQ